MMKKATFLFVLCGALAAFSASGGTLKMYNNSNDGGFSGGEFQAVTSDHGTFFTFCLEYNENIGFNTTYDYVINTGAINGGGGTKEALAIGVGDMLSKGTSYLYTLFWEGNLAAPGETSYWKNHDFNAGQLQKAIWALEDEVKYSWANNAKDGNFYLDLVAAEFGSFANAQANYDPTKSNVRAMNITYTDKNGKVIKRQDQVGYFDVPDAGTTALLLGTALAGLFAVFRRVGK